MDAMKLLDLVVQARSDADHGIGSSGNDGAIPSLLSPHARNRLAPLSETSGLAAIQGLARQAWSDEADWTAGSGSQTSGPVALKSDEERARTLLDAMIAAAKVDRGITEERFIRSPAQAKASTEEEGFLRAQFARPATLDDVTRRLLTRAETIETYAASLLAVDVNNPLSRHYLDMLAARLGLERALIERLEHTIADHG